MSAMLSFLKSKAVHIMIIVMIFSIVSIPFYNEVKNRLNTSELVLNLYKSSLEAEIARFKYLPFILSQNDKITKILTGEMDKVSSGYYLQQNKYATNVSTIYILDSKGNTVAASNWHLEDNHLGRNFSDKPYFEDAMAGRLGQFYGIGTTASTPSFYISYGIKSGTETVGVIAIEIDLSDLEQVWRTGPDEIIVYDVNETIFLSSNRNWKNKTFRRVEDADLGHVDQLDHVDHVSKSPVSLPACYRAGNITFHKDSAFGCLFPAKISIDEKIIEFGWTILSLTSARYLYASAMLAGIITLLLYVILLFSYRIFKNQFNRSIQKLRNQLVENSKLAAIGQMATEVAHEFNQPLAAIYMLLDTTRLLLERKRYREADDNLVLISSHIERMTQQISQMKGFASRHRVPRGDADIVAAANGAIRLFKLTFKKQDVQLQFETSHNELHVPCNEIGLEQIFSNLITNALDAMAGQERKSLTISIARKRDKVQVKVRDNGGGISEPSKIFESFYSTKQRGTGLGLAIVKGIVENSDGSISARNHPEGGAEFSVQWRELAMRPTDGFIPSEQP